MSEKNEKLITDNDKEVNDFKKERIEKRKENKESIEKHLKKFYSGDSLKGLMEDLYPNKAPNDLIPAKKYLSDLGKSTSLEHQRKALSTELDRKGLLWSEVDRLYMEGYNFSNCEKFISEIKKIVPEDNALLKEGIKKLESQGPTPKMVLYFESLLEKFKSEPKSGPKSTSNQKPSRYVSALKSVLIRQVPNLKSKSDDIMKYISENEAKFKKKFKNSLEFNKEIEKKSSELKKCKDIKDIEKVFKI